MIGFGRNLLKKTGKLASSYGDRGAAAASKGARDIQSHLGSSRASRAGQRVLGNRGVQAGLIGGYGAASFASGIDTDRQMSNSFFDLTMGDPNYDSYVMGREMSARSLLMPLPGERMAQSTREPFKYGGGAGAFMGGLTGLALRRSAGGAIGGALLGGGLGGVAAQAFVQSQAGSGAVVTPTTFRDAHRANRRSRPTVDGSVAFGMYNARLG